MTRWVVASLLFFGTIGTSLVLVPGAPAATSGLAPQDCVDDNDPPSGPDNCAQSTDGLDIAYSVTVSPDGKSVYATSAWDDAIVHLDRDTATGALTPQGCVDDNDTGADDCGQTTDGMTTLLSVAVSPDGKSAYAVSYEDDAIVRFDRNTATGALTPQGCIDDNETFWYDGGPDDCAQSTDELSGASSVAVSPDGKSVYVASEFPYSAVVRFDRDTATGALTPAGCIESSTYAGSQDCAQSASGLWGANSVAVSPDGKSVYVASNKDSAIVRFIRSSTTGALTPAGCVGDSWISHHGCSSSTDALRFTSTVAVSGDDKSVYAIGEDSIVRFDRDTTTGALTPQGCIDAYNYSFYSCDQEIAGLYEAQSVTVSPDADAVYVAAHPNHPFGDPPDGTVVRFDRDAATGALTPQGCIGDSHFNPLRQCAQQCTNGLAAAQEIAVSPDGESVYVAAQSDDAIVRFARDNASAGTQPPCPTTNTPPATTPSSPPSGTPTSTGKRAAALKKCKKKKKKGRARKNCIKKAKKLPV